jgi:hypothetical protein
MHKILLCLGILLLAWSPDVIAQDAKPEVDPDIELMRLFDTPGRSWTTRVIHWQRGESPYVETWHSKVDSVENRQARVTSSGETSWGDAGNTLRTFNLDAPDEDMLAYAARDLPLETLDMGFRSFECRRHVTKDDATEITTWVSTEFHPLIVKQTSFSADNYVIQKLTGFHDALVDPWQLWRMVGRSFKLKVSSEDEGEFHVTARVTGCDDSGADVEFTRDDEEEEPETERVEFNRRLTTIVPEGLDAVEPAGEEAVKVKAGEFDCHLVEGEGWKAWISKVWTELPVKFESNKATMELVEFDLGHDMQRMYGTVGNTYTTRQTMRMPNMKMVTQVRHTVTKVEDGVSTYRIESLDEQGRVQFSQESEFPLRDRGDSPALRYSPDNVEEMVSVPAGRFPSFRTETDEMKSWSWNGILVRMELKMEGLESLTELIEVKIQ